MKWKLKLVVVIVLLIIAYVALVIAPGWFLMK